MPTEEEYWTTGGWTEKRAQVVADYTGWGKTFLRFNGTALFDGKTVIFLIKNLVMTTLPYLLTLCAQTTAISSDERNHFCPPKKNSLFGPGESCED